MRRKKKQRKKKGSYTAANADRHVLYEAAVQSVDFELDFFDEVYRSERGKGFHHLREDFCGTASLACKWVKRDPQNRVIGVDLDQPTLDWGMRNNLGKLDSDQAERVKLVCADVLSVREPRVDLVAALNYSYSVFKERERLREYFRVVHDSLNEGGVFIVDAFGGLQAPEELEEERDVDPSTGPNGERVPGFTYVWEQVRFNPVTNEILCRIHFDFKDGTRMENAFSYDWRLWSLPELKEVMIEAGFKAADVYCDGWDEEEDEPDEVFVKRTELEEMDAWVAYVVGLK
jgi:SAM-dependent methyltransferase